MLELIPHLLNCIQPDKLITIPHNSQPQFRGANCLMSEKLDALVRFDECSAASEVQDCMATTEKGNLHSSNYRLYFKGPNGLTSPLHDIPLCADEQNKISNMVVEIPRWTNVKMKITTKEPLNPIKQNEKNNAPRFVHSISPHKGYIWNNGALQQTCEDPEDTNALGDNDPIDIVEIGEKFQKCDAIVQGKVLGATALLGENKTDWKFNAEARTQGVAHSANEDQWKTQVDGQPSPEVIEQWQYIKASKPPQKL